MKNTTRYYRNALKATAQEVIDFRKEKFLDVAVEDVEKGRLSVEELTDSLKIEWKDEGDEEVRSIIIAAKTICLNYKYTQSTMNDVEELTSLLFIPAIITKKGELKIPEDGQLPWIPREYLEPMCESVLSFGKMSDLDAFYNSTDSDRALITTWDKYFEYAKKLIKDVCKVDFEDREIVRGDKNYSFDGKLYVFLNNRVKAAHNIIKLYNYLSEHNENALYRKLTSGDEERIKPLIDLDSTEAMKKHAGQMTGEYPLSPSQRNAISHFCETNEGDILAISGPPGTGKTTLLQSIVANMYVERALNKGEAPVIVASSTNNQAVTNIIDSFGKINICFDEIFEKKWIVGSDSFAIYMPSQMRTAEAERKGYQYTNVNGEGFFEAIESEDNRNASKESYLQNYNLYYEDNVSDILECKEAIHKRLLEVDEQRRKSLDVISAINKVIKRDYCSYYKNEKHKICRTAHEQEKVIEEILGNLKENVSNLQLQEEQLIIKKNTYISRYKEWDVGYNRLSWYIRLFKFLPMFKKKISNFIFGYMLDYELSFLNRGMDFESIIDEYKNQIIILEEEIPKVQEICNKFMADIEALKKEKKNLKKLVSIVTENIAKAYGFVPKLRTLSPEYYDVNNKNIQELNDLLDKVRYVEFWLSVHYFEARWLEKKCPLTDNEKGKTFEKVLTIMYQRLAMLSPCFVMTFYMLPKNFNAYDNNENRQFYIDLIDLLIVDEAGQATLEVAAASFSLAHKAVVVGDEKQIPPVYGIVKAVDCTIAKEQKMISDYSEFDSLERKRLSCSSSSLMGRALLCCAYDESEHGLFLSEHRRCYDEIIGYCNDLLYGGKLKPKRGTAYSDGNPLLKKDSHDIELPPMSCVQIDSNASEKIGTSRINQKEADAVINWIEQYFNRLCRCYPKTNKNDVLAVITPFKAQSDLIKKLLREKLPDIADVVGIGTVHTFQGGEKQVVIFSTVYGINDGYYFIRTNANLMNVAVSRAKDAFVVIGDLRGFQNDYTSPDGLLKKMVSFLK